MALQQVFFDLNTLRRFCEGHLASELDGFCERLNEATKRPGNSN